MVIRNFAKLWAVALVAVACTAKETIDSQAPISSEPVSSSAFAPGTAIVQLDDALLEMVEAGQPTKAPGLGELMLDLGIVSLEREFPDAGEFEERTRRMGLHRFYIATFAEDTPVTKALDGFSSLPGIVSVKPVRQVQKRAVFNDPRLSNQWHYINSGNSNSDINVQQVWENYTTGSDKVIVCVVDEPVDPTHEDLKANLWNDGNGHTGYNYARKSYDLSVRPEHGDGDIGHGTHVAGTIAAVNNNGIGLCGIAGGNAAKGIGGVKLMSHAIFSGTRSADDKNSALAIKEAADKGALISQNSWGLYADGILDGRQDGNVSSRELEYLRSLTIDDDPDLKAAIDYFIEYAGCDKNGNQRADSPMKGGLVIFAAGNEGHQNVDWDPYAAYEPVIAVGASDYTGDRAYYSNFGSWVDIAAPGGDDTYPIWSTVPTSIKSGGYAGFDSDGYAWEGTSMACPHVSGVAALIISYYGGPGFTADKAKEILFGGLGNQVGDSKHPIGRKLDALASFKYGGLAGSGSSEQEPPVITLEKSSVTLKAHESATVKLSVSDVNGGRISISCTPGSGAVSFDEDNLTITIVGKNASAGSYKAVFTAKDQTNLSSSATLSYTILPNHAPEANGSLADVLMEGKQLVENVDLAGLFTDSDGETLTLQADWGDATCVKALIAGTKLSITPLDYGQATITVTAVDCLGATASLSFRVAVIDPAQPVSVSPAVASTDSFISIETQEPTTVKVTVYSSTGALVGTLKVQASAFEPVHLDVSGLAPGRYTAELSYLDVVRKVRIVKY